MTVKINLIVLIIFLFTFINVKYSTQNSTDFLNTALGGIMGKNYKIDKTWDNSPISPGKEVYLTITLMKEGINLKFKAPFYDDPKIPNNPLPGRLDKLWNYEVVEVFFLGEDDKYLEFELGPHSHYILLSFKGERNLVTSDIFLEKYSSKINASSGDWTGEAFIPKEILPKGLNKFNAYAIHSSDPNRVYMSLFPTPNGKYQNPDFHRLEYFQEL